MTNETENKKNSIFRKHVRTPVYVGIVGGGCCALAAYTFCLAANLCGIDNGLVPLKPENTPKYNNAISNLEDSAQNQRTQPSQLETTDTDAVIGDEHGTR